MESYTGKELVERNLVTHSSKIECCQINLFSGDVNPIRIYEVFDNGGRLFIQTRSGRNFPLKYFDVSKFIILNNSPIDMIDYIYNLYMVPLEGPMY